MPAVYHTTSTVDVLLTRLHESHEVSVYEAIDRLVRAAEAVGLDAHTLVRMLDRGMTLEDLLEFIESQMECSRSVAQPAAERDRAA